MWRTTLKGLLAHKLRFTLTALAVFLGVAFMAGTLVLTDTVGAAFDDLFADVNEGVDAVVREESPFDDDLGQAVRPPVPASLLSTVQSVESVEAAEGNIAGYACILGTSEQLERDRAEAGADADREARGRNCEAQGPPPLGFNWPTVEALNPLDLDEGDAPVGPGEVVVDRASADDLDLEVGDEIVIQTNDGTATYGLVGIATFGSAESPGGATVSAWTTPVAQEVMGFDDEFLDIRAVAREGVSQDQLVTDVSAAVDAEELSGVEELEVISGDDLTQEEQDQIAEQLSFFNTFLLVFAGVALFVGIFIIYNTFSIIVAQRTRELALLRAVGANRRQVLSSVLGEALVVGILASVAGLAAGIFLATGLQALLRGFGIDLPSTSTVIATDTVVLSVVVGVLITMISAGIPARKAASVPPIAALRDVAVDTSAVSAKRVVAAFAVMTAGVVALVVGLFTEVDDAVVYVGAGAATVFVGVIILGPVIARPLARVIGSPLPRLRGMTGTIARANAMRNPRRTAATAAALIIGVGLVGFITIFASSARASIDKVIDDAFLSDLVVDSGSFGFGGLPPDLTDQIAELPDVEAVSGVRSGTFEVEGDTANVAAVEPDSINQLFDVGVSEGEIEGAGPNDVFVLSDKADDEGWEVGDTIDVRFADTGEQELTIAALYEEEQPAGTYTMTIAGFEQNFDPSVQFDVQVYVSYAPATDLDQARAELDALVAEEAPAASVQDQSEFADGIKDQINQLLSLVFALLFLAIIIALLGIANSLALSIYERTRELGLLRAVGMTRAQVRSAVRWESVIVALLGTAIGLVVSLFFGYMIFLAIRDAGFEVLDVPIAQLVTIVIGFAIAGVLAGIGPARRASKLDVLGAIATE